MPRTLVAALLLVLLAGCSHPLPNGLAGDRATGATAHDRALAPSYRFILGKRRPELAQTSFLAAMAARWLPAVTAMQAPDGLTGYVSAVPPAAETGLPDEVALAVYASEAAYLRTWDTAAGRDATTLAATLFDPTNTRTTRVVPLPGGLVAGDACDALGAPVDWQQGFTTFFIGRRHDDLSSADFLRSLHAQVDRERAAFGPHGLRGYVFMATRDHKLSFMNWPDMATFGRAMASPEGQEVAADSRRLMRTVQFAGATGFRGTVEAGKAVRLEGAGLDP